MSELLSLRDVAVWREKLGLMPVPLRAAVMGEEKNGFVLLNGSRGSFYLDLPRVAEPSSEFRNNAWSTNVGHAVSIAEREVFVQRWDRRAPERFSIASVAKDPERFHRHLEKDAPPAEMSVVAHGVRAFRSVRQALGEQFSGSDALLAFLVMLAAAADRHDRAELNLDRWRLPDHARQVADEIGNGTWQALAEYLTRGRAIDDLQPDVTLVLRHASGALFQEAHQLAIFDPTPQLSLIPTAPKPVVVARRPMSTGAHFTPAPITRSVVERALYALAERPPAITILDPACGSAEFLREALRQLRLAGFTGTVRLFGFDVSEAACAMARFSLAAELNTHDGGLAAPVEVDIRSVDALDPATYWPAEVDLVLTNPPFVSWPDMSIAQKRQTTLILGNLATQRPDLSASFILKSATALRQGGVLGTVVPASVFDGESSARLRNAIGEMLSADLVARLGSHSLFQGARVDAGLYVGVRGHNRVPHVPIAVWADHRDTSASGALRTVRRLTAGHESSLVVVREGFNVYPNPEIGQSSRSWAPRPYEAWKASERVRDLPTVGALFDVRQGILTGLNKVFVLSQEELERLPTAERKHFRRAVMNESIVGGRVASAAWVFYPYGAAEITSEEQLRQLMPAYYEAILLPMRAELFSRARRTPENWWKLTEHRAWQVHAAPRIVSTYFGDRGSFAWDERGDLAVVQGYGWLPKPRKNISSLARSGWLALLAILNSDTFSSLLSAHSNHVGGGQWNLSKRFVTRVPLPDILAGDPSMLLQLSGVGERIHDVGLDKLTSEEIAKLDELSAAAYGLGSEF